MVVNHAGTGGKARIEGRDVSGKTGTAQQISLEGGRRAAGNKTGRDLRDHGWFVFFAPRDNPQIAGVIFGEHAEHGASVAPIAKHAMETFFAKKEGRPLPEPMKPQAPPRPPNPPEDPPAVTTVAQGARSVQGARGTQGSQVERPVNLVHPGNQ